MNLKICTKILLGALVLSISGLVAAQERTDDAAVWKVVESQWEAGQSADDQWVDELLTKDFVGWPSNSPAPRSRESVRMWERFNQKHWDGEAHELYPLSIVVHEDVAVVHYLYSNAGKNSKGEVEVINGRFTDVLVRVGGDWKFLSWHGGPNSAD